MSYTMSYLSLWSTECHRGGLPLHSAPLHWDDFSLYSSSPWVLTMDLWHALSSHQERPSNNKAAHPQPSEDIWNRQPPPAIHPSIHNLRHWFWKILSVWADANYLISLYFCFFAYKTGTVTSYTYVVSVMDLEFIAMKCFNYNLVDLMRHFPVLGL